MIPPGWRYLLYEDKNYKGKHVVLEGTGRMQTIPDLRAAAYGFNDKTSSSQFLPRAARPYSGSRS